MTIIDNHTHRLRENAVVDIDPISSPEPIELVEPYIYSVGIHPWNANCVRKKDLALLRRLAKNPRVVAIGECGLDSVHISYEWHRHGSYSELEQSLPDMEKQMELLKTHIELSEELRKPLLLHIVKRYPEIIRLRNKLKPTQPWIIHGFRGKPGLAADLLKFGFYLSYGEHFNPQSVALTPDDRLLVETDESDLPIADIVASLVRIPQIDLTTLSARD